MDAIIVELLLLELLLVALLAVLSASEAAIHTIRRPQLIEELAARGRRGRRAGTMGRKAVEYLASIQVAEFLIVFAFSGISAAYIAPRLSDLLRFIFGPGAPVVRDVAAVAVTVAALCLLAVLFGIFVPRTIGARHAQTADGPSRRSRASTRAWHLERRAARPLVPRRCQYVQYYLRSRDRSCAADRFRDRSR